MSAEEHRACMEKPKWYELALPAGVIAIKSASSDLADLEVALKQGLTDVAMQKFNEDGELQETNFGDMFDIEHTSALTNDQVRPMTTEIDEYRTRYVREDKTIMFIAHDVS